MHTSRGARRPRAALGFLGFLLLISLSPAPARAQYPPPDSYPAELELVEVLFAPETVIRLRDGELVDLLAPPGEPGVLVEVYDAFVMLGITDPEWHRLDDSVPEALVDQWELDGELATGEDLYNLNNIFRLRIGPTPATVWDVGSVLEDLPSVMHARPVPLPPELPAPNYQSNQGYLASAASTPVGIDALASWGLLGGDGTGVTVCDLEYSWNTSHLDLGQLASAELNTNIGDPFSSTDHGTAVAGVLAADANASGVTGICFGATLRTCGTYYGVPQTWNPAGAMMVAMASLTAGDVMVLEQQWSYTGNTLNYIPVEWYTDVSPYGQSANSVYSAIRTAVANGIHVVEAGGNGGVDTGTLSWQPDSGAVIVGAGGAYLGGTHPNGDLQKLAFSSYGPRFDLQGWGEDVVTCGYGDLYNGGANDLYTALFDGTSSATPVVAGAIACVSGWHQANVGGAVTPALMRQTLINTGTPQAVSPSGNIGPRPDISAAIAALAVPPVWVDATTGNLGQAGNSMGVAWGDYDLDGLDDLYLTQDGVANLLFANQGGLWTVIPSLPTQDTGPGRGAAWGDLDADGDLDLYFANAGAPNRLLRNDGPMVFTDISTPPIDDPGFGTGVAWVDADGDGYLELSLAQAMGMPNALFDWRQPPWSFFDVAMPPMGLPGDQYATVWCDWDLDGDQDAYLASSNGQTNRLCRNDGGMLFTDVSMPPVDTMGSSHGAAWGDYDNDGDLDLFVGNYGQSNQLFRNDGPGAWLDVSAGPIPAGGLTWNVTWGDYDNDADLDVFVSNLGANQLLRNDGGGVFTDVTQAPLTNTADTRGAAWADYDNDGELDLYMANYGAANVLVRNDQNNGNNWIQVQLQSPQYGLAMQGARIECYTAGLMQVREVGAGAGYLSQNSLTAHFGLGPVGVVDSLVVRWPNGAEARAQGLAANGFHLMSMPQVTAVDDPPPRATTLRLDRPVPNPFNPRTTLSFEIPRAGRVWLTIHDLRGRVVRRLVDGRAMEAGPASEIWNGRDDDGKPVASGSYVARLRANGSDVSRPLVLVR